MRARRSELLDQEERKAWPMTGTAGRGMFLRKVRSTLALPAKVLQVFRTVQHPTTTSVGVAFSFMEATSEQNPAPVMALRIGFARGDAWQPV